MILQIKKYTIVILLLAIVITALILSLLTFFYDSINLSPGKNTFSPCEKITENAKRYSCYQNSALSSLQKNKDIKKLSAYALEFPYSRRHLMGHAIARAVLIVSGYNLEVTAEKCLPSCITGYWHGIAEEWGKHTPKRAQEFVNFLTKLCNNKQSEGVDCSGHSIGHLYISVNKNLDENLILCDNLDNDAMFPQCIMGVMHQYRIDGGAEDVFGICKNYTGRIKKACYEAGSFIYPRWRGGDTSTTRRLEYCKELNFKIPIEFNRCYDGIGDLFLGNSETPPIEACENLNSNFKQLCKKGLSSPKPFVSSCGLGGESAIACGGS